MIAFAQLYARLDATTSSNAKLAALQDYLRDAEPADAAWAVYFLAGGRPRQLVPSRQLRELAMQRAGLSDWLFEESYSAVGDLAETIALLLPEATSTSGDGLAVWVEDKLLPLRGLPPDELAMRLDALWAQLDRQSLMVSIKLITGAFRVGVSKLLVTRALAAVAEVDAKRVAQRLVGYTDLSNRPTAAAYERLIAAESDDEHAQRGGQPYPFFLAHPLQRPLEEFDASLGSPADWLIEWKWDGIRAQLVKRDGQLWVWSRGEELISERFPELQELAPLLPDGTVIDGELVVWRHAPQATAQQGELMAHAADEPAERLNDQVEEQLEQFGIQPFALLQQRIGRKTLSRKLLEEVPVAVLAYDLLEWQGEDWRSRSQHQRRAQMEQVVASCASPRLMPSPLLHLSLIHI